MELTRYAKIKNNVCICYFGSSIEYLEQLKLLIPFLKNKFKDLNIYLGCKDEVADKFAECSLLMKRSDFRNNKLNYAHFYEIRYNGETHPIEDLLNECNINEHIITNEVRSEFMKANIIPYGSYPNSPLTEKEVDTLKRVLKDRGYEPLVNNDINNTGLVAGIESFELFRAAGKGIKTILVPTGVGENLYKKMFPKGEILRLRG